MEGRRLSRSEWLVTYRDMIYVPQTVTHSCTNPARCTVTSLIVHNTLPLRHATNGEYTANKCKYGFQMTIENTEWLH